jgi:saccharopine dehydrogenase (NAD+, L-lysine-forming)
VEYAENNWSRWPSSHTRARDFAFPAGIGPVECVNVEHEEVLLMPRWIQAQRVTFKYGLGAEFIGILRTLHQLGLDRTDPVRVAA